VTRRRNLRATDDDPGPSRPAREHLSAALPAIARRIRSLRRQDTDWSMRTSELMSSTMRRVLIATGGGSEPIARRNFWSLAETIMRHLLIDRFRRKSVRSKVMRRLRDETTEDDPRERTADSTADSRDAAARLLEALTPEECMLVQLRLKGLGWRQVGDTLGISEDAARQRWSVLRRRARMGALGLGDDAATGLPPDS
jgi:RNA polymerase sigma factor (sigma-70 family)